MTDIVDSKRRSELMAGIRGRDTAPERAVRRIARRMELRFRLHQKYLRGYPGSDTEMFQNGIGLADYHTEAGAST